LLTRYTALLFGPIAVLLTVLPFALRDRAAVARMRSRAFLLAPLLAAAILLPWLARYAVLFGDPLLGFRRAAVQIPNYAQHGSYPVYYYLVLLPGMLGVVGVAAALGGAVHALATRHRLALTALTASAFVVAWMSRYAWKEPRLITAVLPFLAIVIGTGAAAALRAASRRGVGLRASVAVVGLVLVAAYGWSAASTRPLIEGGATLGYPSFLGAMTDLRERSRAGDVVMAANCHQVSWYTRLRCGGFRGGGRRGAPGESFDERLDSADWVVITSFERGQPQFVEGELTALRPDDFTEGRARRHRDANYWTVVLPSELLRARREAGSPQDPSRDGGGGS
jgi:hypothetical protein